MEQFYLQFFQLKMKLRSRQVPPKDKVLKGKVVKPRKNNKKKIEAMTNAVLNSTSSNDRNTNDEAADNPVINDAVEINKVIKVKKFKIIIHRLTNEEIANLSTLKFSRYELRNRNVLPKCDLKTVKPKNENRKVTIISQSNKIWSDLTKLEYNLMPGVHVLAKMSCFQPWPARINSVYIVNNEIKCYVLFYGTDQIGSVLKKNCVPFNECGQYTLSVLKDIKRKNKWQLDYQQITQLNDHDKPKAIAKLTRVQQFLLSLRELEILCHIPYEDSIVFN